MPLHLLVKLEVVFQIVDIHVGNFNMKLTLRWFPQIVDRDSGNLYPIYIKKIVVLASEPVGGRSRATELPCYSDILIRPDQDSYSEAVIRPDHDPYGGEIVIRPDQDPYSGERVIRPDQDP